MWTTIAMLSLAAFGISFAGTLASLSRWRWCLFAMAFLAATQDPIRKLTPGAPGYLVLLTTPVLIAGVMGMMMSIPGWWRSFARRMSGVEIVLVYLLVACLPPMLISLTWGPMSWVYTLLGVASYSTILLSIVLGFHLLEDERSFRRVFGFYCIVTSVALLGGWLQYSGGFEQWRALGSDALGMTWIRYRQGYVVELIGGFYRSPDVMGWHASACTMLASLLAVTARSRMRWFWLALAIAALGALLLCGRRKMVFMLPLFVLCIAWLYWSSGRGRKLFGLLGAAGFPVIGLLLIVGMLGGEDASVVRYYAEGSLESLDRLEGDSITSVVNSVREAGFFGGGLGFATPGAHQLSIPRPRTWQESGPSRIVFELGVPGMIAFLALLGLLVRRALRTVRATLADGSALVFYPVGMFAFFVANSASLVVSGQILGDPFIASMFGLSLGFVLGFSKYVAAPGGSPAVGVSSVRDPLERPALARPHRSHAFTGGAPGGPRRGTGPI